MRNKTSCICCALIMTFFCFSENIVLATESPPEKQYIVKFNNQMALFHIEQREQLNILTESELQECLDAGIVDWYEEDYEVELLDIEYFEDEQIQNVTQNENLKWDLAMINAEGAKRILCEGQDINVGIIDSGIMEHPDIKNNIKQGYNYLNSSTDVSDNIGHGTFVAGLIAANDNQNGIVGVANETNLIPLKCFDSGKTTTVSVICSAIKDAVDIYDCDIINMSLGLVNYSQKLEEYIKYATDAGVIVIAAVGNKGTDVLYYPAAYEKVIGVGSINANYNKSDFSQYNSSVDFLAPGEDVWSTDNSGSYSQKRGTSFSTPLVTGLVATMLSADNTLTYDEMISYMSSSTTIRDEWKDENDEYVRNDNYGYGLINVTDCLNLMLEEYTFFISPIDCEGDVTQVAIVNNSDNEFSGYCMWTECTNRGMMDMDWEWIKLSPGEYTIADTDITSNIIKCFLWKDITNLSVISDFREREAN